MLPVPRFKHQAALQSETGIALQGRTSIKAAQL
jgi:hypothetical protein